MNGSTAHSPDCARARENPVVMLSSFARYRFQLVITTMTVLLLAMAGCGRSSPEIVGKWQASGGDPKARVWEFSETGSIAIGTTRGRYSLGDNNRVKIQTPFGTMAYHMEFWGDHMILTEVNGAKLEFDRIK
jgi:hypothetical protein